MVDILFHSPCFFLPTLFPEKPNLSTPHPVLPPNCTQETHEIGGQEAATWVACHCKNLGGLGVTSVQPGKPNRRWLISDLARWIELGKDTLRCLLVMTIIRQETTETTVASGSIGLNRKNLKPHGPWPVSCRDFHWIVTIQRTRGPPQCP